MAKRTGAWSGWITFATVMLTMIGAFNILEGLAALLRGNITYIDQNRLVVVNLTTWGLLALVSGALLVAIGLGLFSRSEAARGAAVVVVGLHAILQLTALAAFPIWSLLMIALDVVILFALTVHWAEAPGAEPMTAAEAEAADRRRGTAAPPVQPSTGTPRPAH
jgi:hypothetical protein